MTHVGSTGPPEPGGRNSAGLIGTLCGVVGMLASVPAAATCLDYQRAWERLCGPEPAPAPWANPDRSSESGPDWRMRSATSSVSGPESGPRRRPDIQGTQEAAPR